MDKYNYIIGLIGKSRCGKTTFLKHIKFNKIIDFYEPTNLLDCETIILKLKNNIDLNLNFWEFSGHDEFLEKQKKIIKENKIFYYFCFINMEDKESYEYIRHFINFLESESNKNTYFILPINSENRVNKELSEDYIKKYSNLIGGIYYELNLKDSNDIKNLLHEFWKILIKNYKYILE